MQFACDISKMGPIFIKRICEKAFDKGQIPETSLIFLVISVACCYITLSQ